MSVSTPNSEIASVTKQAATTKSPGQRLLLLTPYTGGNLGDGAIQEAVLHHIYKRIPSASIQLISISPRTTERLHGIRSFPLSRDAIEAKGRNPFKETQGNGAEIAGAGIPEAEATSASNKRRGVTYQ
jgi:hypothetical protein